MDLQKTAEICSLALTVPTVVLGVGVIWVWGPSAIKQLKAKTLTSESWFIIGVVVAFLGSVLDNIYWGIPWTLSFMGDPNTDFYMTHGVYFNIWFRQTAGIIAAYCHLKAADLSQPGKKMLANRLLAGANLAAVVTTIILWAVTT